MGGHNLYIFCFNNPIVNIDSLGNTSVHATFTTAVATGDFATAATILESLTEAGMLSPQAIAAMAATLAAAQQAQNIQPISTSKPISISLPASPPPSCPDKKKCPPCPPPRPPEIRIDKVPPSRAHWPHPSTHMHVIVYKMNQNPKTCQCFEHPHEFTWGIEDSLWFSMLSQLLKH
ncbi:hypothetical protein [Victivallis sp. Marseille-Q1083]|uniref:hypothetical protein n=1 Tax=Victivallis sp. Marseille-Q1083 TaxID=2717288 RepID=UPI00158D00E8|nr:hypothetical protein [Victivallis sp. Marseille-Q1083]